MLKVFLVIGLSGGRKKTKQNKNPFADHSYGSSVTALSRCFQSWNPVFLNVKTVLAFL